MTVTGREFVQAYRNILELARHAREQATQHDVEGLHPTAHTNLVQALAVASDAMSLALRANEKLLP